MRETENVKSEYEYFINLRSGYVEKQYDQCRQYDQSIFLLSSGVFGVTISFLSEIIKAPEPKTKVFLVVGWSLVIISICISLSAFIVNYYAHKCEIFNIDIKINNLNRTLQILPKKNTYTKIAEIMNICNLVSLITGLVGIVVYISHNI